MKKNITSGLKKFSGKRSLISFVVAMITGVMLLAPFVNAQSIQDQINQLQNENAKNNSEVAKLEQAATSYQDAIKHLRSQITILQDKIDNNKAQRAKLDKQIEEAKVELAKQKGILSESIRALYVEGQISTFEMLASSKDLSDFVDKQVYRSSVQEKVKDALDKVTALKLELQKNREVVQNLLEQQQQQQAELSAAQQKQLSLLSYNQAQQDAYNKKTADNQSKIDALIAEQRKSNFNPDGGYYFIRFPGTVKSFSPNSYPYKYAGFGMSPGPGCVDNDGPDPWGYCTRQCVSYTAWAVLASGRSVPMFWGNARDWVGAAYANGIPVYRSPQAGDIAISTSGYWGHAMYVESVTGGTFRTSEYNTYLTGQLSYQTRNY